MRSKQRRVKSCNSLGIPTSPLTVLGGSATDDEYLQRVNRPAATGGR